MQWVDSGVEPNRVNPKPCQAKHFWGTILMIFMDILVFIN